MISATSNWIAANANPKKKPIFLIEIEGYNRAFSTAPGIGSFDGLALNPVVQFTTRIVDFGGLGFSPTTAVMPNATPAGNIIFAFLAWGGGPNPSLGIADDAGNTWTMIFQSAGAGGGGSLTVWSCVAKAWGAGNNITWDPTDVAGNHHNQEFFIVEVPASYSGYTYGSNSGTTPSGVAANATCTVGSNSVSIPIGAVLGGDAWAIFMIALAQQTSSAMGVNLLFFTSEPIGPSVYPGTIAGASLSQVLLSAATTGFDWIVGMDDISLTVSDLDGGADLADFAFNVQDLGHAITADMGTFVFEGKKCVLKQGFGTIDGYSNRVVFDAAFALSDYLTLFTGKIDSVASDNNNEEYKFTVPDIRKDLSKIIYQTADDGFPTDSNHRKTISANPLDILLDILENQVGYSTSDIDVAGITNYRDTIFAGEDFVFSLDSPPAAKDFIENEILKPLGGYHWTDNLGVIRVKFFYPLAPASVATLDHTNLLNVPLASQAGLVTEVTYRFDATTDGKFMAESVQDWGPGIAKYGLFGEQVIESVGLRSGFQGYFMAQFISRLIFLRYGDKQLEIDGLQTIWSQCRLEPGDIISLTSSLVPDRIAGTMGVTAKAFEVLDRSWSLLAGRVTFRVLEIDLSKFKQYLITPNAEVDFAADTAPNQAKYMYLCNAAGKYSTGVAGNTLC